MAARRERRGAAPGGEPTPVVVALRRIPLRPYREWRSHPRAVEAPGKALGDDGPADPDTPRIAGERQMWRVRGGEGDPTCRRVHG
jgi:hypothetical protein